MTAPLDATTMDMAEEARLGVAPLPTPATLSHRRNVLYQLIRFAAINLKMIRVISASH